MSAEPQPLADDVVLWRYLSATKLFALFSQRAVHFARCDTFEDPFEGAIGLLNERDSMLEVWDSIGGLLGQVVAAGPGARLIMKTGTFVPDEEVIKEGLEVFGGDRAALAGRLSADVALKWKNEVMSRFKHQYYKTFVSCWHALPYESEAMWRLYAKDVTEGTAIQTTAGALAASLSFKPVTVARVDYSERWLFDYTTANQLNRFRTIRRAFEHEQEVRAIVEDRDAANRGDKGVDVPVEIERMLHGIVISPYASPWLAEVVTNVAKQFQISAAVRSSELGVEPFHF